MPATIRIIIYRCHCTTDNAYICSHGRHRLCILLYLYGTSGLVEIKNEKVISVSTGSENGIGGTKNGNGSGSGGETYTVILDQSLRWVHMTSL